MINKILIITTYYPPDTAIAAVRPYMFAKYLALMGYDVTVVRSGEINSKADTYEYFQSDSLKVYSYMGDNSQAERFARGESITITKGKSRASFLPTKLQKKVGKIYHTIFSKREFKIRIESITKKFEIQKEFLNSLKVKGNTYDVVFATYGELENIYAGKYAAELFNCKLILDFRDLIASETLYSKGVYKICRETQKNAVISADICTCVSEHTANELQKQVPGKTIYTLYNGYEPYDMENDNEVVSERDILTFCYTGQLYEGLSDISPLFKALRDICKEGKMNKSLIRFYYAGNGFFTLINQAKKYGMESILVDKGYLGKQDIRKLQFSSDIFTVLSWNTHKSRGILTGKFYEGIRCGRPILSVVSGNEANSELNTMNEKYHYGFCYEAKNHSKDFAALKTWLVDMYNHKQSGYSLTSLATADLFEEFRYDKLTLKLDQIIKSL